MMPSPGLFCSLHSRLGDRPSSVPYLEPRPVRDGSAPASKASSALDQSTMQKPARAAGRWACPSVTGLEAVGHSLRAKRQRCAASSEAERVTGSPDAGNGGLRRSEVTIKLSVPVFFLFFFGCVSRLNSDRRSRYVIRRIPRRLIRVDTVQMKYVTTRVAVDAHPPRPIRPAQSVEELVSEIRAASKQDRTLTGGSPDGKPRIISAQSHAKK